MQFIKSGQMGMVHQTLGTLVQFIKAGKMGTVYQASSHFSAIYQSRLGENGLLDPFRQASSSDPARPAT
jgi:hypothetical protein